METQALCCMKDAKNDYTKERIAPNYLIYHCNIIKVLRHSVKCAPNDLLSSHASRIVTTLSQAKLKTK